MKENLLGERVRLKRPSHGEHPPHVQKHATGLCIYFNNITCKVFLDKIFWIESVAIGGNKWTLTEITMFSDEIEKIES